MMRCIAVDDEQLALDLLEDNISKVPFLQLVGTCRNAVEATRLLGEQEVDLVFLDVQMPGLTGLQWVGSLVRKPLVILITAYEKYALQSFELEVVDYLLKPVSLERFVKACNRAKELYSSSRVAPPVQPGIPPGDEFFFVHVDYSLVKIMVRDILWVEGLKDYIKIYLQSASKPVITRLGMKTIEDMLPAGRFIRVHKSYIVAVSHIHSIRKNSIFLGTVEIPISDHYREAVQNLTRRPG